VDSKRLHEAIKELRAELDRVNLAIQQIEIIAGDLKNERKSGGDSAKSGSVSAERSGKKG
jgi:hypothetical protein